jgi:hypothetical protein
MAFSCVPQGYFTVLLWSLLGLVAAIVRSREFVAIVLLPKHSALLSFLQTQCSTIISMYALSASSQGLLVCMIFSIIFVVVYCLYLIVVRRLYAGIKTITPPHLLKYVLIAHLLCATWYYWAAVIT